MLMNLYIIINFAGIARENKGVWQKLYPGFTVRNFSRQAQAVPRC